jgi:hypothetical protein
MTIKILSRCLLFSIVLYSTMEQGPLVAIDNGHFYRAPLWRFEPHVSIPYTATGYVSVVGGSATQAFTSQGCTVPLLSLFGPEEPSKHGLSGPPLDFGGSFTITEAQIDTYVDVDRGFFFHMHLPVRSVSLFDIEPLDHHDMRFDQLLSMFKRHNLIFGPLEKSGPGDLSLLGGWSTTTYRCGNLDFIDVALQAGVLFPTAPDIKARHIVDIIPLGQGGGFGIPLSFAGATGIFDWMSLGIQTYGIVFFDTKQTLPIPGHQGFLRLATERTEVSPGTLWQTCVFLTADHCIHGLSATIGYDYGHKGHTSFSRCSSCSSGSHSVADRSVADHAFTHDPLLAGWNMGTLHIVIEYDWAHEDRLYGPRIAFEYNYILHGHRIFKASTIGGYGALSMEWLF